MQVPTSDIFSKTPAYNTVYRVIVYLFVLSRIIDNHTHIVNVSHVFHYRYLESDE